MKPRIELHIEELVLRDFPYEQRQQIAAAVEAELQRLLAESGLPVGFGEGRVIPQVELDLPSGGSNEGSGPTGAQIARGILGNITPSQD